MHPNIWCLPHTHPPPERLSPWFCSSRGPTPTENRVQAVKTTATKAGRAGKMVPLLSLTCPPSQLVMGLHFGLQTPCTSCPPSTTAVSVPTCVYPINANISFLTNYRKPGDWGALLFHHLCQSPSWEPVVGEWVWGKWGPKQAPTRSGYSSVIKPGCQRQPINPTVCGHQDIIIEQACAPLGVRTLPSLLSPVYTDLHDKRVRQRQEMPWIYWISTFEKLVRLFPVFCVYQ